MTPCVCRVLPHPTRPWIPTRDDKRNADIFRIAFGLFIGDISEKKNEKKMRASRIVAADVSILIFFKNVSTR